MTVVRDEFDQLDRGQDGYTERDFAILTILEEVASPNENPDRTLAAYLADIYDAFEDA